MFKRLPKHRMGVNKENKRLPHMVYNPAQIQEINFNKRAPENIRDKIARFSVQMARSFFDRVSSYDEKNMTHQQWVNRAIFLETVAGVPGMVGGMLRHMKSLRKLESDNGWIVHLLEEAENERMHLFFFLQEKQPGILFRMVVLLTQGIFFNFNFVAYMMSPKFMHRFVGFLEEEAVHTYTVMLQHIEKGSLQDWQTKPAPHKQREYYNLPETATYKDIILCIRADEIGHREYNHLFADIHGKDERMVTEELEILGLEVDDMKKEQSDSLQKGAKNDK